MEEAKVKTKLMPNIKKWKRSFSRQQRYGILGIQGIVMSSQGIVIGKVCEKWRVPYCYFEDLHQSYQFDFAFCWYPVLAELAMISDMPYLYWLLFCNWLFWSTWCFRSSLFFLYFTSMLVAYIRLSLCNIAYPGGPCLSEGVSFAIFYTLLYGDGTRLMCCL